MDPERSMEPTEPSAAQRLRREGERPDTTDGIANLIVIGASIGGQQAIEVVLNGISQNIPAAIIIMVHSAPKNWSASTQQFHLNEQLQKATRLPVVEIVSGNQLRHGVIYVVPREKSVSITGHTLELLSYDRETGPNTTVNILFESAARTYGERVIGVILSGLLKDGTAGIKAVHEAGGLTMVQDPSDAAYPSMPENAMKDLPVTFCLNLSDIGPALDLLARRSASLETGLAVSVRMLKERVGVLIRLIGQSHSNPSTEKFLSHELSSLESEARSIQTLLAQTLGEKVKRRR
jgi:two-component system, chemotaxis family, protein-glutamate methylesterase/glutaminase